MTGKGSLRYVLCRLPKFLHDPSGAKKKFLSFLEKRFLGHTLLSTLIPGISLTVHSDPLNLGHKAWKNPWDHTLVSTDSFFDLMRTAQKRYLHILEELNCLLSEQKESSAKDRASLNRSCFSNSKTETRQNNWEHLLEQLGNLSYHSGLDAGIPS